MSGDAEYYQYLRSPGWLRELVRRRVFFRDISRHLQGLVLDIGCGIGGLLREYPSSLGIDANPYLVSHCRHLGLRVCQADATRLPFESESFSGVVASNVLEHIPGWQHVFGEAVRILVPGGRLVVALPTEKGYSLDPTHVHFIDEVDVVEIAERSGVRVRELYRFPVSTRWVAQHIRFCELRVVLEKD